MFLADTFIVRPTFCHALLILCRPIKFLYSRFSDIPFKPPATSAYVAFFGEELENQQQWIKLVKRCTKPDRKEFQKIAMATAIGFAIMGFIGFFVRLIHIPINNIIVGS
uniref:Protein transport protein Sec61 subunit gamma n=1 Tax=Magallana gigas TaxID=29159 RepID=A0A8W8N0T4_MAGGI